MSTKSNKNVTDQANQPASQTHESPASYLAEEYNRWRVLFQAQPILIQRFCEVQGRNLADALAQSVTQTRFSLPDRVITTVGGKGESPVPADQREQLVGGLMDRLTCTGLNIALRQRLDELEASPQASVRTSAGLYRFAIAVALIQDLLPSGRSVRYQTEEGDEIPTIPTGDDQTIDSAITATTDAVAEESDAGLEENRGELLVPYVPAARRFFLPQWVAFDDQDSILVNSSTEAEAHLGSMQRFLRILHAAVALAPYMVADETYQQKRYGMLGQLINQGRALARFETREIISTIQRRAAANDLNRGLSISMPFFDDQSLEMRSHNFDVIPAGRIMFIPGFVVLAARKELAKVAQDTRLDRSTRKHLLSELHMLETAFQSSDQK